MTLSCVCRSASTLAVSILALGLSLAASAVPIETVVTQDLDTDGIHLDDNCAYAVNPAQGDLDGDEIGDACDPNPLSLDPLGALALGGPIDIFAGDTLNVVPQFIDTIRHSGALLFFELSGDNLFDDGQAWGVWDGATRVEISPSFWPALDAPGSYTLHARAMNSFGPAPRQSTTVTVRLRDERDLGRLPEPSTLALFGLSLIGLSCWKRKSI